MTLDEERWRANFGLRCWAATQEVGKGRSLDRFLLTTMAEEIGRGEDGTPLGRFTLAHLSERTCAPEAPILDALQRLSERGYITFETDETSGVMVVGFVVGPTPSLTRDEALAHGLALARRTEAESGYTGEHVGLLIMIAWRCRQRGAQSYGVRDLVQAAELGTPARLYRALDDLRAGGLLVWNDDRASSTVEIDLQFT